MLQSSRLRHPSLRLASCAALLAAVGCERREPERRAPGPPSVEVSQPVVKEIVEWDDYTGRLAAKESVEVRARVGGYLDSIHFTDGQVVKKGDLLFVIDPRPFKAVLDAADAEVQRLETRLALAKNDVERGSRLVKTSAISAEEFDARSKAADEAVAALAAAKARREQARLDVEFTEIKAPLDGRIGRHLVSVGNLVSGGTAQATVLTTIVALDPIECYFDVEEQAFLKYARLAMTGERPSSRDQPNPVRLAVGDESEHRFSGHMDFVDNQLDATTGTLRGRAMVDNPDLTLLPGLFVRIQVPGSALHKVVLVPDESIATDQTRRFVWVVDAAKKVERRIVTLGSLHEGARIVRTGLEGTETIVVRGIQRVRPGITVAPEVAGVSSGAPSAEKKGG